MAVRSNDARFPRGCLIATFVAALLLCVLFYGFIVPGVWPILAHGRAQERYRDCDHNMMFVAQALVRYEDVHKGLPAATTTGTVSAPPLSWRVALLPFLLLGDRSDVATYDRHEAWDGPHNTTLHGLDLWYYHCPA